MTIYGARGYVQHEVTMPWEFIKPPWRRSSGNGRDWWIDNAPWLLSRDEDGCDVGGPHCLDCKLAQCVFDGDGALRSRVQLRYAEMRQLAEHNTVYEVALAMGVSVRTVHRALQERP